MDEFVIKGVTFYDARNIPFQDIKATPEKVPILKDRGFLELYRRLFEGKKIKNILEFGIAKGGSVVYHTLVFEPDKYVGIDIIDPQNDVLETISKLGLQEKVKLYFNTSQDDENKIRKIIEEEFPSGIDLIIDDASHLFDLTLKSFEISFPYLNEWGYYVIEDWGWAHWRLFKGYSGLPALSQLGFLLIIMHASYPELLTNIRFEHPALILVQKGHMKVIPELFNIKNFININDFRQMTYLNYMFYNDFVKNRVLFMGGNVDVVDEEKIAGWILDSSWGPPRFGVRVNGKIVYEGVANVEREDIKKIYGVSYKTGFYVKFKNLNVPEDFEELNIEVFHLPSGVIVPGNYKAISRG